MGYASYFEDISSRVTTLGEIVNEYSEPSSKRSEYEMLRKQKERPQDVINKLKIEITELQLIIQRVRKDKAEANVLLRREQGRSDSLSKQVSQESSLRKIQERTGRDMSELVMDFIHLFQGMNEITKSNAWHKDRAKIKQLESFIETGLRKN